MEHHVSLQSARFEYKEPKPYFINPNCFGEDVAGWLVTALGREGFMVDEPIQQEDYGWGFWTAISLAEDDDQAVPKWPIDQCPLSLFFLPNCCSDRPSRMGKINSIG